MKIFLISMDFELRNIVENRFQKSSLLMNEWNDLEKKTFSLYIKAMNVLFCALDKNKFNQVSIYETPYKSTCRVKESKINLLVHSYELFHIKQSETIRDMYTWFMNILNGLKVLGKSFSNVKPVNKILRSLPTSWDPKVITIQ